MADLNYYSFLFLIWLVSILLLKTLFKKSKKTPYNLPPSPPSYPIIGHIHHLYRPLYKGFRDLSAKYGPLMYLRLGVYKCVIVSSASVGVEIFKNHDLTFSSKPKSPFGESIVFGDYSFFNSPYGDYWKFMKKLCMSELLGMRQIQRSRAVRRAETMLFLRKLLDSAQEKKKIDVNNELTNFTNDVTCMMIMSTRCTKEEGEAENCRDMVLRAIELARKMTMGNAFPPIKKLFFLRYGGEVKRLIKDFDALFERKLREHEERTKREGNDREDKDLIDILLEAYHDENAELRISRNHVKAFILDLFVGGTSTSAETMQWTMAELLNHPEIFKKVREEIETVVGKDRLVEEADTPNLPYLQAVVKETLRLYPPLPIVPRVCREDCKIGEHDIPRDTAVLINSYALMRDPQAWDHAEDFRPERFLVTKPDQVKEVKGLNFQYLPFGVGRRMCPGENLALTMVSATVAALVQCFDFDIVGNKGGEDGRKVNMEVKSEIITNMVHPLYCVPVVHFNPFCA